MCNAQLAAACAAVKSNDVHLSCLVNALVVYNPIINHGDFTA